MFFFPPRCICGAVFALMCTLLFKKSEFKWLLIASFTLIITSLLQCFIIREQKKKNYFGIQTTNPHHPTFQSVQLKSWFDVYKQPKSFAPLTHSHTHERNKKWRRMNTKQKPIPCLVCFMHKGTHGSGYLFGWRGDGGKALRFWQLSDIYY